MPALPLDEAGKYVAGAYVVFVLLILVYVAIIGAKIARIERRLTAAGHGRGRRRDDRGRPVSSSCWPSACHHKTAPLALREQLALPDGRAARGAGRADRARRGARGGGALHLQPHRALPGDRATRWRPRTPRWRSCRARPALRPTELLGSLYSLRGREAVEHLFAVTGGPGLDDRRRGRDPGPGQARLRAGAGGGRDRPDLQPAVPRRAGRRQARAHRDRASARAHVSVSSVAVELAAGLLGDAEPAAACW